MFNRWKQNLWWYALGVCLILPKYHIYLSERFTNGRKSNIIILERGDGNENQAIQIR